MLPWVTKSVESAGRWMGMTSLQVDNCLDYIDRTVVCHWHSGEVLTRWQTAQATLRLSAALVDGIQSGLARRGFDDVRPVHGFAFAELSAGDTTTSGLGAAMGMSKQAASQLVDHLITRGYLNRVPAPHDRRARLLVLTERGRACTAAAEQAAADVVDTWRQQLDPAEFDHFADALSSLARPGRLRPAW